MTLFAQVIFFGWIPIVLGLFLLLPPRHALVAATVTGWLTLPNIVILLPGIPDYSKTSATVMGMVLGSMLFDPGRLFILRPRWIDLPMLVWCLCPFFTSLSNDLGAYDGFAGALEMSVQWGIPYLCGRVYLSDLAGLRKLALAIAVGGLVYVPLCLFEIRFSPQLQNWCYGTGISWEGTRWDGYRPKVFLATGIELGMWMTAATLTAYWLWAGKALTHLWGWSFGLLLLGMTVTTVMCRSTGALLLLMTGAGALWVAKHTKSRWPILLLALVPSFYTGLRAPGIMSGAPLVEAARSMLNEERATSLRTRVHSEDKLAAKALQRPILGWGGFMRSQIRDDDGKLASDVVFDGYWIIVLGRLGLVGLVSLLLIFLLPTLLFLKRFPASTWATPAIAPAAVLATLLSIYMIDCLVNAFMNLSYLIAVGGLAGLVTGRKEELGGASAEGPGTAEVVAPRAAVPADRRAEMADRQEDAAIALWSEGRYDDAERALQLALRLRQEIAGDHPDVAECRQDLAIAFENFGRLLKSRRRPHEVEEAWLRALDIRESLAAEFPDDEGCRRRWADVCNDLAWLLALTPDAGPDAAPRAVRLAQRSVELLPTHQAYWNTLGMAFYRDGQWNASAVALKKSIEFDSGGSGFDHFVLAMAYCRLGQESPALESYRLACRWLQEHKPGHPELLRLRDEAAALLGI